MNRILSNGGKVYRATAQFSVDVPLRVFPGRLSVSRTIGDIEAKFSIYKGNPKVIICKPDVYEVALTKEMDFLFLGCDGIFECATNEDIARAIWRCNDSKKSAFDQAGEAVDNAIKYSAHMRSTDNLTGIIILLNGALKEYTDEAADSQAIPAAIQQAGRKYTIDHLMTHKHIDVRSVKGLYKTIMFPHMKQNRALLSPPVASHPLQ